MVSGTLPGYGWCRSCEIFGRRWIVCADVTRRRFAVYPQLEDVVAVVMPCEILRDLLTSPLVEV
jgi:hypothetical protein